MLLVLLVVAVSVIEAQLVVDGDDETLTLDVLDNEFVAEPLSEDETEFEFDCKLERDGKSEELLDPLTEMHAEDEGESVTDPLLHELKDGDRVADALEEVDRVPEVVIDVHSLPDEDRVPELDIDLQALPDGDDDEVIEGDDDIDVVAEIVSDEVTLID